jgi:hypothetical protein
LEFFPVRANNAAVLQDVVKRLFERGISRRTLAAWAVEAGYSRAYVGSALSRIFVALGLRQRAQGAGRKPTAAALELATHARNRYGVEFLNVLRAAWRVGKSRLVASGTPEAACKGAFGPIVEPQLDATGHPSQAGAGGVRLQAVISTEPCPML